jgi:hypothetical protein
MRRFLRALRLAVALCSFIPVFGSATFAAAAPARIGAGRTATPTPALLTPIDASGSQTSQTAHPGDPPISVYTLKLYNPNLLGTEQITSISFDQRSSGGTTAQKDASWQPLTLSSANRARDVIGLPANAVRATASFSGGQLRFTGLNLSIASQESLIIVIAGNASLVARDGDRLDLRIGSEGDIVTAGGTQVKTSGTLDPSGDFSIDGMTAAQITLAPVTTPYFPIGALQQLALAVRVPPNGYANDALKELDLVNLGTAHASDLTKMDAWLDDGDGVWERDKDPWIGSPVFTGSRWVLGGLNEAVNAPAGAWLFVTVDVAETATPDATVQLSLPVSPPGLQMASTNDGPIDHQVADPVAHVISLIDRVVITPQPLPSGSARPDAPRLPLLAVTLSNTYADDRTLNGLVFSNTTAGPGTISERDGEFARVELRLDGNGDGALGDLVTDPVIATAVFAGGRALFSGLGLDLDPGKSRTLFVTGDASLLRARDGDVLSGAVAVREDFQFKSATAVAGSFPLSSANGWTIDGMVAAQIDNGGAPPVTLGPGGGPAEALDVTVHRNGYQDDQLQSFSVVNLGTASPADLAGLRLWRDGGNGSFDGGAGDDSDLGPLTESSGVWSSAPLSVPLGTAGQRLFVAATASGTPADSVTIRLAIPTGGLTTASDNDGPLDVTVANAEAILLANGGLLASLGFDAAAVTVGQSVTLRMAVHNTAPESLVAVAPTMPVPGGTAVLTPLTGPLPASIDLPPGGSGEFQWTFRADGAGVDRSTARASGTGSPSGQPYSSFDAESGELRVLARADSLLLTVDNAMPQAVSRGQIGVLPLYLTFQHPDPNGSPVAVHEVRLRIEREDGSDVIPSSLLTRAVVISAGETLQVATPDTSGSMLTFALPAPLIVSGPDPATLAIGLDISPATAVPDFRLVLTDTSAVHAADAPTGAPVRPALQGATWPAASGLARVQATPTGLDVAADTMAAARAGRGQNDVVLARLNLFNPGTTGVTSDVRLGALDLKLADTLGVRIAKPGHVVHRLKLRSGPLTYADRVIAPQADSVMTLTLSPLLAVPVNTPTEVLLVADVSDTAALGSFRLEVGDSARFDARDPNSGNRVPVFYAAHPVAGPPVTVEDRADTVFVAGVPHLPPTVGVAARGVHAISVVLRHPGLPGTGRLKVEDITARCIDETGAPLVPATFIDRMDVLWNGTSAASVPDPPASGNAIHVPLPGLVLEPGDTARVTLVLDFEASAPPSTFALAINNAGALEVVDANLDLPATAVVEGGGEFPLLSGITRLVPPSRTLLVDLADAMPAVVAPDGLDQTAGTLTLTNSAAAGSGPIRVGSLVVRARDAGQALAIGAAAGRVSLAVGGSPIGSSAALTADSTTAMIVLPSELSLEPGVPMPLELRFATRLNPAASTFALAIEAADIGVVQPGNPLLDVAVLPAPGRAFPLMTGATSYAAASLAGSWSSFPNPFSPARGGSRFTYYLTSAARVTLEIWTGRGERVAVVVDGQDRTAGLHQDDRWDGRNGQGATVQNGVYVALLTVEMAGRTEHLRRKVAVMR